MLFRKLIREMNTFYLKNSKVIQMIIVLITLYMSEYEILGLKSTFH